MRVVAALRALLIALAVATTLVAAPAPAYARTSIAVDIGFFYNDLSPYGDWYDAPQHGWIFVPRVSSGWRPYTVGHWVWTDEYGWLWVSDEDFGWATFHYGRWYHEPAFGWAWVPGYDWGPSWCSFRYGGGYTGWAPLPPNVGWSAGFGFQSGGVNIDAFIQPDYYTFVPTQSFVNTGPLYRYAVPVSQNPTIIRASRNVTSYSVAQGRVVNRSLRVDTVEKAAGRRVPRARAVEVDDVKVARNARLKGDEVQVFKPAVREAKAKAPPKGKPLPKREAASDDRPERERGDRGTAAQDGKQKLDDQRAADRRADEARRESDRRRDLDRKQDAEQQAKAQATREKDMAEQKAQARRRAEEAKAQTDREKERAEQQALAKRRGDEAKAQADREKDMAEQKAQARRRAEEGKAQADRQREREADRRAADQRAAEQKDREMRQAREQQERERGLADQRQRDAQRREPPQVHTPEKQRATEVNRDKRSPAPPAKKSREKEKDKNKDKDKEKPPNR